LFRQRNAEVVDWLEDDPNHILMTYDNETNNLRPAIRKVDIVSGKGKMVQSGLPNINTWYTDNTGTPRIGQGQENNSEAKAIMRIWDMTNDKWRHASDYPGLDADATIFGFTHKQDELVIGDYAGKDTLGLYVYDLNAKFITRKIYHNEKYDVQDVVRSKDGNEIIGVRFTTNSSEVELLGPYDRLLSKVRDKFPKFTVEYVDQTFSGDKVIFKVSGPYEPVAL